MAERGVGVGQRVLGIVWDGTGYGVDGTLWGGEFLVGGYTDFERVYSFKEFRLLGGERAIKEPYRVAFSLLYSMYGRQALKFFDFLEDKELAMLERLYISGYNSPYSSSVGRLFDGIASILGLVHRVSYEGQAAMMLESMYDYTVKETYPFDVIDGKVLWEGIVEGVLKDKKKPSVAVSRFINTLAEVCLYVSKEVGIPTICLSGGVMQNDPLVHKIREKLKGFEILQHQTVPPNDGGISLGQAVFGGLL
ncbi:carbamoyltransferase HypF [Thermocrinis minervae]|uniref:Kae1-like domain-containing protein n=1 Tax=Thermocrinis minervae TaxID=381751 RepID=UPI0009A7F45E|nr:carbamoyltransferase HypF [Thermocrinis minervae]